MQLLKQRVDFFELSTPIERLTAINRLKFPLILTLLETYLSITRYLRSYITWYIQIIKPLQERKIELLKPSPRGGRERKSFSAITRITNPTDKELQSFAIFQDILNKPSYLVHFNPY